MAIRRVRRRAAPQGGFILVTVFLLILVLGVLSSAMARQVWVDAYAAQRSCASTQAMYFAEGGIDQAIVQLRGDSRWSGGSAPVGPSGSYTVTVESLPSNRVRLTSVGRSQFLPQPTTRTLRAIVQLAPDPQNSLFSYALFAKNHAIVRFGARVDSYDSSKGPYNRQTAGRQGNIGSNGRTLNSIEVYGGSEVKGDVIAGPESDLSGLAKGQRGVVYKGRDAVVAGTISASRSKFKFPAINIPRGVRHVDALTVSGHQTKVLPGGTYWFNYVRVEDYGRLQFTGPTRIYVTENFQLRGRGLLTAGDKPSHLTVYVKGHSREVSLTGDSRFYGALYAPDSSVNLSWHASVFGSLVGEEVGVTDHSSVHFDTALTMGGSSTIQFLSWEDLSL